MIMIGLKSACRAHAKLIDTRQFSKGKIIKIARLVRFRFVWQSSDVLVKFNPSPPPK